MFSHDSVMFGHVGIFVKTKYPLMIVLFQTGITQIGIVIHYYFIDTILINIVRVGLILWIATHNSHQKVVSTARLATMIISLE